MFTFLKVSLFLSLVFVINSHAPLQNNCTYATPNKPIGHFDRCSGIADAVPFSSFVICDKSACEDSCRKNDECLATSFYQIKSNCSFYNITDLRINHFNLRFEYSIWKFCNMSEEQQSPKGRCPGQWVTYKNNYIDVNFFAELNKSSSIDNCKDLCLENKLCGFVRRNLSSCFLIPKWPYENLNYSFRNEYEVDNWTCVDNYVEQITAPTNIFKPLDEKCTGHWTISSRNRRVNGKNITGIFFHTQNYSECLDECNQYANCRTALFNVTYSICILTNVSNTQIDHLETETRFITFEWKCVKNDSHKPYMNEDEKRYESLGMKCYQIEKDINLFIGKDNCDRPPQPSEFVSCYHGTSNFNIKRYETWDIRESCLINQTYWTFPATVVQMNISGYGWMNLTKIYSGIQQYWLAYLNNNNLKEVDYVECRRFNASISLEKLENSDIISRKVWQAQRPIGFIPSYSRVPNKLVVTTADLPQSSCKTVAACIDILRNLQIYYFNGKGNFPVFNDILFNFLIDQNGHIYEGLGWKKKCFMFQSSDLDILCIAHMGSLETDLPSEKFFISLKKLIRYSVVNGHMDKNYELYLQEDLKKGSDYNNLVIVMKNWYGYKGFIPNDCTNYSLVIICLNAVTVFLMCLLLRLFHSMFYFTKFCSKCSFLKSDDVSLRQIFPFCLDLERLDSTETRQRNPNHYCIIYQKSSFISSESQLRIVKLIKIWFFNQFLETINSQQHQNSLSNYLRNFPHIKNKSFVFEVDLARKEKLSNCNNIILCLNDKKVLRVFQRLIKTRCCICCYFDMELFDFTKASFDTVLSVE